MTTVIAGFRPLQSLQPCQKLEFSARIPDPYTLDLLKFCTTSKQLHQIHARMLKLGLVHNHFTLSKLIQLCTQPSISSMDYAESIFSKIQDPNSMTINTMIRGFAGNDPVRAIDFYTQLLYSGFSPDKFTYPFLLKACSAILDLGLGHMLHGQAMKFGFSSDLYLQTAQVHFYAVCGNLKDARKLFDEIPERSLVLWNAFISGCCKAGFWEEALAIFHKMRSSNVKPDEFTMVGVIGACAHIESLDMGKWVHSYIEKQGLEVDVYVGSALVDMYSKCGCIDKAIEMFDKMPQRNLVSWTSIISALASHGLGKEALARFKLMTGETPPDDVTCVSVLSACSHAGLVEDGREFFTCMFDKYGVLPKIEHYECVVDMFGRAGLLDEACEFINEMPMVPSADMWRTLLGACKVHKNLELAERVMERLMGIEDDDDGDYMVLANAYAHVGRWDDAKRVRRAMSERGMKKKPGCSWIEVNNIIHEFYAGDEEFYNFHS